MPRVVLPPGFVQPLGRHRLRVVLWVFGQVVVNEGFRVAHHGNDGFVHVVAVGFGEIRPVAPPAFCRRPHVLPCHAATAFPPPPTHRCIRASVSPHPSPR